MRESPRQRSRCCRFLVSGDSPDRDLLQSLPAVTGCSISCPAIFISNGAGTVRPGRRQLQLRQNVSLSLALWLIQKYKHSWKEIFRTVHRLVPQNQIKPRPGQTAWCCRRILSRVLSHAGLHRFVGARARKPRQGYLQHSPPPNVPPTLLPKHFLSRDNDNDGGRGMKAAACSPVSPEFA